MHQWLKTFAIYGLTVSGVSFGECETNLKLSGNIEITTTYEGVVTDYDDVKDENWNAVVLPEGNYKVQAKLTLSKEQKNKCEYLASNLEIRNDGGAPFHWRSPKTYKSRIELKDGNFSRFHLNQFTPTAHKRIIGESGESITRSYKGERPLYLAGDFEQGDNVSGTVAYFDFGDGHEFFGNFSLTLN